MSERIAPVSRVKLVQALRNHGWEGPDSHAKHEYMHRCRDAGQVPPLRRESMMPPAFDPGPARLRLVSRLAGNAQTRSRVVRRARCRRDVSAVPELEGGFIRQAMLSMQV